MCHGADMDNMNRTSVEVTKETAENLKRARDRWVDEPRTRRAAGATGACLRQRCDRAGNRRLALLA